MPSRAAEDNDRLFTDITDDEWGAGHWFFGGFGADARRDARYNRAKQAESEQLWDDLFENAPSVDDFSVEYEGLGTEDEYGDLRGDPSQFEGFGSSADQLRALEQLQTLSEGGFTDADRAMMREGRNARAQQMGAQNAAAAQAMQARGMGGSGAEMAARLGASQGAAMGNASADAGAMQGAQMRSLAALQGSADMSNTLQQQEIGRRGALDAFNARQMDWRRARAEQNTGWANRTRDSRANALQAEYENRERATAGKSGQYQAGQNNVRQDGARTDAASGRMYSAIGGAAQGLAGGAAGLVGNQGGG